jgi:hypothetical protein
MTTAVALAVLFAAGAFTAVGLVLYLANGPAKHPDDIAAARVITRTGRWAIAGSAMYYLAHAGAQIPAGAMPILLAAALIAGLSFRTSTPVVYHATTEPWSTR